MPCFLPTPSADRGTYRHLTLPAHRSRQHEIRNVHARQQHHQTNCAPEHEQGETNTDDELLVQCVNLQIRWLHRIFKLTRRLLRDEIQL